MGSIIALNLFGSDQEALLSGFFFFKPGSYTKKLINLFNFITVIGNSYRLGFRPPKPHAFVSLPQQSFLLSALLHMPNNNYGVETEREAQIRLAKEALNTQSESLNELERLKTKISKGKTLSEDDRKSGQEALKKFGDDINTASNPSHSKELTVENLDTKMSEIKKSMVDYSAELDIDGPLTSNYNSNTTGNPGGEGNSNGGDGGSDGGD